MFAPVPRSFEDEDLEAHHEQRQQHQHSGLSFVMESPSFVSSGDLSRLSSFVESPSPTTRQPDATTALTSWYVLRDVEQRRVQVVGVSTVTQEERRFTIKERIDARNLVSEDGLTLRLVGPMNASQTLLRAEERDPARLTETYLLGFPENWSRDWPSTQPPRRSQRQIIKAAAIPQPQDEDEDDALFRKVREEEAEEEAKETSSEDDSDDEDEEDETEEDGWTKSELQELKRVALAVDPLAPEYWTLVARAVGREEEACQAAWTRSAAAARRAQIERENKRPRLSHPSSKHQQPVRRSHQNVARVGTAKFRREIRLNWQRKQRPASEDVLLSTPFKAANLDIALTDESFFESSWIEDVKTPMPSFRFGSSNHEARKRLALSEAKEEEEAARSPGVLEPLGKSAKHDEYMIALVKATRKRDQQAEKKRGRGPTVGTPVAMRAVSRATESSFLGESLRCELQGVQGCVTPNGTVRMRVPHELEEEEEEEEASISEEEDEVDLAWV